MKCERFPCTDVKHDCYIIPEIEMKPDKISIVMKSEAVPANQSDYYYATGDSLFQRTTVQAFNDAGIDVSSIQDILNLGVYLTTAVKCGKTGLWNKNEHRQRMLTHTREGACLIPQFESIYVKG